MKPLSSLGLWSVVLGSFILSAPISAKADIQSSVQRLLPATVAVQWTRSTEDVAQSENDADDVIGQTVEPGEVIGTIDSEDAIAYAVDLAKAEAGTDAPLDSVRLSSGTVVSDDGLIVTAHIPDEAGLAEIVWMDGQRVEANVVVRDLRTDLQLLKADVSEVGRVELRQDAVKLAQPVVTVTAIDLRDRAAGTGIVTALQRPLGDKAADILQTDINIGPMSAGAPLGDTEGRVAGIVIAKKSESSTDDGPAFVVPARYVQALLDAYKPDADGVVKLKRGWLGIQLNEDEERVEHPYIAHVFHKSPAEAGKLKEGDVILEVRGEKPKVASDVVRILGYSQPQEEIKIVVNRDGADVQLNVTLGEYPEPNDFDLLSFNELQLVYPSQLLIADADGNFKAVDPNKAFQLYFNNPNDTTSDNPLVPELKVGNEALNEWMNSRFIITQAETDNDATIKVQRSDVEKQLNEVSKQVKGLAEQVRELAKALEQLNEKLDD